ncbi:MAG: helix-turn-helix transcriptional regulator [Bacteroidaceae bacterium]|nr:helix-turn-helix transcriptional regulator [Bacteroidaceae bacterium]
MDASLTARQEEVAYMVGFGLSRKEVAAKLGVSYKTIDNEVQQVYARIGASKVTELTIFCFCRKFKIPISSLMVVVFLVCTLTVSDLKYCRARNGRVRTELLRNSGRRVRDDYVF